MYCILAIFHEFVTFLHEFGLNFSVGYFWAYLGHFSLVKWGKTGSGRKGTQISSREEYVFFFLAKYLHFFCTKGKWGHEDFLRVCKLELCQLTSVLVSQIEEISCKFLAAIVRRGNDANHPRLSLHNGDCKPPPGNGAHLQPTPHPAPLNPTQPPPSPPLKTHPTDNPSYPTQSIKTQCPFISPISIQCAPVQSP